MAYDGLFRGTPTVELRRLGVTSGGAVAFDVAPGSDNIEFYMYNKVNNINWIQTQRGEQFVTSVFMLALGDGDWVHDDRAVVLDIGANAGFYGLLSASLGYQTVLFDPQPQCASRILLALRANGFLERARVVVHPVSNAIGGSIRVSNASVCEGRFPINEIENNGKIAAEHSGSAFDVATVSVRDVLGPQVDWQIMVVKVDTEGHELYVLRDLLPFFRTKQISHAVVELSPRMWRLIGVQPRDVAAVLLEIAECGYRGRTMEHAFASGEALHNWVVSGRLLEHRDLHLSLI
jgi:FkbM family methyltransferase